MLTSFKLAEALAWLTQHSGHTWTESELFSMCTRRGIPLHAAPPLEARCAVLEMAPGAPGGMREAMHLGWRKAILHPIHVGQLWQVGETEPAPVWEPMHDADAGRWAVFDPPVRVTREHLAIKRDTLRKVLGAWRNPSPVETRWRAEDAGVDEGRPAQHVAPAVVDLASLATPAELLDAFQHWLKAEWFDNLSDRAWLRNARRHKGKSGRNGAAPLFCPFAVMRGLMTSTRGERLPQVRGWHILREKFPAAYAAHEHERPGAQSVGGE